MLLSHSSLTTQLQLAADANKRLPVREQDAETDPNSDGDRWASVVRLVCCVTARSARRRCLLLPPPRLPPPPPLPPLPPAANQLHGHSPLAANACGPAVLLA